MSDYDSEIKRIREHYYSAKKMYWRGYWWGVIAGSIAATVAIFVLTNYL